MARVGRDTDMIKCKTKREFLVAKTAHEDGYEHGKQLGIKMGITEERERARQSVELQHTQAKTALLQQAAHFQECITKLLYPPKQG